MWGITGEERGRRNLRHRESGGGRTPFYSSAFSAAQSRVGKRVLVFGIGLGRDCHNSTAYLFIVACIPWSSFDRFALF